MKTISLLILIISATILLPIKGRGQSLSLSDAGNSIALAEWRAANYSDVRYNLSITLEKKSLFMKGDLEVLVNLTDAGAKSDLILDWRASHHTDCKDKFFAKVVAVNNETKIPYLEIDEHIVIPKLFLKTGENVVKIQFAAPGKTGRAGALCHVDKEKSAEYVYSLFAPSHISATFPVFDQPDLKAVFHLDLKMPFDWIAVSNTEWLSVERRGCVEPLEHFSSKSAKSQSSLDEDCGTATYHFSPTKPISTDLFMFAVSNSPDLLKNLYPTSFQR
jgi:aminopeptidase N